MGLTIRLINVRIGNTHSIQAAVGELTSLSEIHPQWTLVPIKITLLVCQL